MINILKKLLDFIYETKCYFCSRSKEDTIFCSKCYNSIEFIDYRAISNIENCPVYAVTYYKEIIQKLIRAVKYHNKKELAVYQAKIMYEYWQNLEIKDRKYTVIPVPMFYSKARKRKYNHMDLVCEEFCKLTGYEFNNKNVIRTRETAPQYKLSKKEREKNLKNAFDIKDNKISEPILIMDDISTTGSTLSEIIKVLNKNGVYDITCFVTAIPEKPSEYIY
ncbi:MAG: hypothetical protein K6C94_08195 [Candidatus Gastranaerophilales bacterium]|nr:hypothetical protein [Candidatus Gastranaerophilales bacterium]